MSSWRRYWLLEAMTWAIGVVCVAVSYSLVPQQVNNNPTCMNWRVGAWWHYDLISCSELT